MLPLLRELPEGEVGERVMTKALHLTFSLTTLVYATIGLAGYIAFGDATPPNILGGFKGAVGGVLAFVFCAYICLCFAPTVPPLRETLLRLLCATAPPPPPAADAAATATVSPGTPQNGSVQQASPCPPSLAGTSERRKARVQHVVLTAAIIGLVFLVVALLPGASATLFAFTGASGVCFVSFIFPVLAFVWLPRPSLFAPSVDVSPALDAGGPAVVEVITDKEDTYALHQSCVALAAEVGTCVFLKRKFYQSKSLEAVQPAGMPEFHMSTTIFHDPSGCFFHVWKSRTMSRPGG